MPTTISKARLSTGCLQQLFCVTAHSTAIAQKQAHQAAQNK
jgi:hypothetical protein